MKVAASHLVFALTALVAAALVCFLGFLGCVALSVATNTSFTLPGLVASTAGSGAELASARLLPTSPAVFGGVAVMLYAAMVVTVHRQRKKQRQKRRQRRRPAAR